MQNCKAGSARPLVLFVISTSFGIADRFSFITGVAFLFFGFLFSFYRWQSRATLTTGLACWPPISRHLPSWDPLSRQEGSPRVRFDNSIFASFSTFLIILDGAVQGYWCMFPASCLYGKFICLHPCHGQGHEWTSRQIHVDIKVICILATIYLTNC